MSVQELLLTAELLEKKLDGASLERRLEIQPAMTHIIDKMRANRVRIPARIRQLESSLCDEAIEARFDNMPV